MENVAENKQMTFSVKEPEIQIDRKPKKDFGKQKPTYWICHNHHVFEHKYRIHPDREKKMRCPICKAKIRNKTNKSTYLYYLKKKGRVDEKKYRAEKIAKEKKDRKKQKLDQ